MRADEREKLLKEIEKKDEAEATRSMYFRVGKTAHKAIAELAAISGANKSEIVRKLVTKGLTGKDFEIGQESQSVKLDWLVRASKRNGVDIDALTKGIKGVHERLKDLDTDAGNTEKLLFEICGLLILNVTLSKSALVRLIRSAPRDLAESKHPELFAEMETFDLLRYAVNDLDELARFYDISSGRAFGTKTFLGSKIEKARKRILDQAKKIEESTAEAEK